MRKLTRAELILPVTIVAAGAILALSEFMVTFEFTPPGGEALGQSLASDRHSYALVLLSIFAVASMLVAVATGLRTFAIGTGVLGVAALLIFLIVDLPDAGKLGTIGGDSEFTFSTARAEPQSGFIAEAFGAVVLGLASVAFATLSSRQLQAPLARFRSSNEKPDTASETEAEAEAERKPKESRARRPPAKRPSRDARDYAPFDFESKKGKRAD